MWLFAVVIGALDILRRERDEASEQIRSLRGKIKDLETAIAVLEGQPAQLKAGRATGDLKLSVMSKLQAIGYGGATPKEIAEALTKDGRPTSDASVSSTLSRLKNDSQVINHGGRWFAANASGEPQKAKPSEVPDWNELDEDVPF